MSTLNEQLQASIEEIGLKAAEKRVGAILGAKGLQPLPETQKPARRTRSDKGVPEKPPSSADEVTLRVTVDVARSMATGLAETFPSMSALLQDQIITQLKRKIDSMQKQK